MKTNRAVTINPFADESPLFKPFVVPAGTEVIEVTAGNGSVWAVKDTALVARLSGSVHDAYCRYAFVPADAVDQS